MFNLQLLRTGVDKKSKVTKKSHLKIDNFIAVANQDEVDRKAELMKWVYEQRHADGVYQTHYDVNPTLQDAVRSEQEFHDKVKFAPRSCLNCHENTLGMELNSHGFCIPCKDGKRRKRFGAV